MDNADSTIIKQLIDKFNLLPHPEGGYYAETYRSDCIVSVTETSSVVSLNASTAIYFLVLPSTVSRLHRIKWDEMWHFYLGGPLVVVELVNGSYKETLLGQDILNGERVQYLVKGNTWFGCYPQAGTTFSFVGCTVSPGFEFRDFELGNRENLCEDFKAAVDIIEKLT